MVNQSYMLFSPSGLLSGRYLMFMIVELLLHPRSEKKADNLGYNLQKFVIKET